MRTRHAQTAAAALPDCSIQLTVGRSVHHTRAGRLALPLSLFQGGNHRADVSLVMTAKEAETLVSELSSLLLPATEREPS
ncbi:hypothetical protein [Actinacidiphila sp. bgisy144]|uniref:hypothetical protein n=1 Tax=Actinacidiphila sp. bgisy144 TaxID=3413791 RepID=UPI003EC041F5